ncbi:hypothetical protein K466DRAFT_509242 [Polyporus arcularius HHB13444]|uniref:ATPase AAA-type core domain-containing protein n=1 Tax=Polyporus arcularius HHB13444 TaxID=1314778 RepID=A0A5C3Q2I7_9APHY|nr:hypothetical protein K466DRAFT_509242 [Polyporus arcularius HHB13444]
MPAPAKRTRSRKVVKDAVSARQTSLLDVFSVRPSSKKNTPSTSAAVSENGSVAGDEVIDILSSDVEPLEERPADSSSPMTAEDGSEGSGLSRLVNVTPGSPHHPGGSWEAPIVIVDSSPIAPARTSSNAGPAASRVLVPPKPVYSIFAPRKRPGQRASSQGHDGKHSAKLSAPYPDDASQHVRGPQTVYDAPLTHFSRRHRRHTAASDVDVTAPLYSQRALGLLQEDSSPSAVAFIGEPTQVDASAREGIVNSIPPSHRSYPAIARLLESSPAPGQPTDAHSLWSNRWRPKCADQVLGNEQSALYLREWLLALKLHISGTGETSTDSPAVVPKNSKQKAAKPRKAKGPRGTKRPRIVRDVERKRRRVDSEEPEGSWIADDSDDDDPLDVIGLSDDDAFSPRLSRLKRATGDDFPETGSRESVLEELPKHLVTDDIPPFSYTPPKFGDTICNTLLLAGPSGCGKTAAVYACADELGWEVFEVYPGIGERSGAAMQKLIGEVGKNHLVTQNQHQKGDTKARAKAKSNFFAKRVVSDDERDPPEPHAPPTETAETEDVAQHAQLPTEVSQSIVLIEEVDVLYREDTNFWPTLVKIIKECRRPVVMTCNDISLVPLNDLPLQTVLHLTPCPVGLATSYLQLLCLAEGHALDSVSLRVLYETLHPDGRLERREDQFLHPLHIPPAQPDLRRCLAQLQLGAAISAPSETRNPESTDDLSTDPFKRMVKVVETRSFVDSGLRRPGSEVLRDLMANIPTPSSDDVVGLQYFVAEPDDFDSPLPVTFSNYDRDDTIEHDLLTFCKHHLPSLDDTLGDTPDLPPVRTSHCGTLLPILDRLRVPREHLVRDSVAIFVDYEPWVRYMVRADDARISAYLASGAIENTTRRTRNSQRSQWERERWVPLDDHERNTLMLTAFDRDAVDGVANAAAMDPEPLDSL